MRGGEKSHADALICKPIDEGQRRPRRVRRVP